MSRRAAPLGVFLAVAVLLLMGSDAAWQAAVSADLVARDAAAPARDPVAPIAAPAASDDPFAAPEEGAVPRRAPRERKAAEPAAEKQKKEEPAAAHALRTGKEAIQKALAEPVDLEFIETPLSDVVDFLQDRHRIMIQINKRALDDVGIGTDTPITKKLQGISLRSALRLILRELDLTYIIDNEVLLITTPEDAISVLSTEVYEVADLVTCRDEKNELWEDYDPLIEAITIAIHPTGWDESVGDARICGGTFGPAKVLIVSQTQEAHEQIADLLAKIRGVAAKSGEKPEPPRRSRPSAGKVRGASSSRTGTGDTVNPAPARRAGPPHPETDRSGGPGGVRRAQPVPPPALPAPLPDGSDDPFGE